MNWANLTLGQRIRHLELEGYVVLPDLLNAEQVAKVKAELYRLPTKGTDYSEAQRSCSDVHWTDSPCAIELIAQPTVIDFLHVLFGDELICTSCVYAVSKPGHPGIAIHTDAQPYGSAIFGMQASAPRLVRVLYYLDDLTPERAPFKVIPRSHLSLPADGNPYKRYLTHPDEVMVLCLVEAASLFRVRPKPLKNRHFSICGIDLCKERDSPFVSAQRAKGVARRGAQETVLAIEVEALPDPGRRELWRTRRRERTNT